MTEDDVRALLQNAPVVESGEVNTWGNPDAVAAISVWPPGAELDKWRVVIFKQAGAANDGVIAFCSTIEPYLIRLVLHSDIALDGGDAWQRLPDGMWFTVESKSPGTAPAPDYLPAPPADDAHWLTAESVVVEESSELDVLTPQQAGQIVIRPLPDGTLDIWAAYRRRLSPEDTVEFKRFVVERVYVFLKNGPQEGLWFKRQSDDGWQVTMTIRSTLV
jgi:hypothetical protein